MTMTSVGKAAGDMVTEIRRQFKEIPGLFEGTGKPDTTRCVEISTKAALREMCISRIKDILSEIKMYSHPVFHVFSDLFALRIPFCVHLNGVFLENL